jgi:hypothetical protein
MKITRNFVDADRYGFDFGPCSTSNGWAQVDTSQDASYFGTWANPFKFTIFCYCEGDTILTTCEDDTEFCGELRTIKRWNEENGHRFRGIDPGFNEPLKAKFCEIGLSDLLH